MHGRSAASASAYAREMEDRFGLPVTPVGSAREAVIESDIVVTTTPSREAIVRSDWVRPGTHVTAMGSDGPDKRELEGALLGRADKVVADRLDQCLRLGEIHHAPDRRSRELPPCRLRKRWPQSGPTTRRQAPLSASCCCPAGT